MQFLIRGFVSAVLVSYTLAAHANEVQPVSKQALFQHLSAEVMLPLTNRFSEAADQLSKASNIFCAAPQAGNLEKVRKAWQGVHSAWQPLEVFQLGPAIERRAQRQINAWPARPKHIEALLQQEAVVDVAQLDQIGVSAKGLPAIEYLLYPDQTGAKQTKTVWKGKRCELLKAYVLQVESEASGLAKDWREPNGGFAHDLKNAGDHQANGFFSSQDQALSDIVNLLIAGLDSVKIRKIGKPLEKSEEEVSLERIESWRSGTSLAHIKDNLRGFELVFFGAGRHGIGIDDYLTGMGRPVLAELVREDLEKAQTALSALRPPMRRALVKQREEVEALHRAVAQLQRRMEGQIASALKVDLGFNANDGD